MVSLSICSRAIFPDPSSLKARSIAALMALCMLGVDAARGTAARLAPSGLGPSRTNLDCDDQGASAPDNDVVVKAMLAM